MKKLLLNTVIMLAALTFMWGCKSDDDDKIVDPDPPTTEWVAVSEKPNWSIDWTANDAKPNWEEPNASLYEHWMIIVIRMEKEIEPYVSEDDPMAVFIDGELRGLSQMAIDIRKTYSYDEGIFYILKVYGNQEAGQKVKLSAKYYCNKLMQLFTIEGEDTFVPEGVMGTTEEDFILPFLSGGTKYPVTMNLQVQFEQNDTDPISPSADDMVAVFVGDECRGCTTLGSTVSQPINFSVRGRVADETATLRYYSVRKNAVTTFSTPIHINAGTQNAQIKF